MSVKWVVIFLFDHGVIPGKTLHGGYSAEKDARRKLLFKKNQRNVNEVRTADERSPSTRSLLIIQTERKIR